MSGRVGAMGQTSSSGPAEPAAWSSGPKRPLLGGEEVHVWLADLDEDGAHATLSAEECERAEAILSPARRRWVRSRVLLRELLSRYLQEDPGAVRFVRGPGGKPALAGPHPPLRFSISHSGTCALYALSACREVGVDVQTRAPDGNLLAIAERAFPAATARRLARMDQPARRGAFLSEWTRHEAKLKCRGLGLAGARRGEHARLWSTALPPGTGGAAALAVEGSPGPVRCWRWAP